VGLVGAVALAFGALRVTPGLELDIHTLTAACFAILIGTQLVMFGALARRYAMVEGVLPPASSFRSFLMGMDLETILRCAGLLFAIGVAGAVWAVVLWGQAGFGPIHYHGVMRILIMSLTAVAVAVQLAASGFLASVFTLRR
jgi:hypothetical protein